MKTELLVIRQWWHTTSKLNVTPCTHTHTHPHPHTSILMTPKTDNPKWPVTYILQHVSVVLPTLLCSHSLPRHTVTHAEAVLPPLLAASCEQHTCCFTHRLLTAFLSQQTRRIFCWSLLLMWSILILLHYNHINELQSPCFQLAS